MLKPRLNVFGGVRMFKKVHALVTAAALTALVGVSHAADKDYILNTASTASLTAKKLGWAIV